MAATARLPALQRTELIVNSLPTRLACRIQLSLQLGLLALVALAQAGHLARHLLAVQPKQRTGFSAAVAAAGTELPRHHQAYRLVELAQLAVRHLEAEQPSGELLQTVRPLWSLAVLAAPQLLTLAQAVVAAAALALPLQAQQTTTQQHSR